MHKIFIQILCVRSVKVLRFNFLFFTLKRKLILHGSRKEDIFPGDRELVSIFYRNFKDVTLLLYALLLKINELETSKTQTDAILFCQFTWGTEVSTISLLANVK